MDVVFKAVNNKAYPYNVSPEDSISSVLEKLYVDAGINKETHSFKIIFQGKILSPEQKFSEFAPANPKDKPMFVFMSSKNKPVVSEQTKVQEQTQVSSPQVPAPVPTVQVQNIPAPTTTSANSNQNSGFVQSLLTNPDDGYEEAMGEMDETDKLRAALVGMMVFVRANPQMMELFNNNFEAFAQVIMSPHFKPMFESMLGDMAAGDEQMDNFTDSMLSHGHSHEHNHEQTNNQSQTISLTQEDLNNIGTLEALGFPKQACVQAYVLANKNLDMAASMLMDM